MGSTRTMLNHCAASGIPPSEIPSGARREERAHPSLPKRYRGVSSATRSSKIKKCNAKAVPHIPPESRILSHI